MSEQIDLLATPINLTLTAGEVNYVLSALGQKPFGEVASLITKIKEQGDSQFAAVAAQNQISDAVTE